MDDLRKKQKQEAMERYLQTDKGKAYQARQKERRIGGLGAKYARDQRERFYAVIRALKTAPCVDCNQTFDPVCMDFDHRPGERKLFNIANGVRHSDELLLLEIAKCDLVCACCHRLRTHRLRNHAATCRGSSDSR